MAACPDALGSLRQPGQFASERHRGRSEGLAHPCASWPNPPGIAAGNLPRRLLYPRIKAPVRESGQLENAGSALLIGPAGHVELRSQVICAWRHIHMSPQDARQLNVANGQKVSVRSDGERQLTFDEVVVRVREDFALEFSY